LTVKLQILKDLLFLVVFLVVPVGSKGAGPTVASADVISSTVSGCVSGCDIFATIDVPPALGSGSSYILRR